MLKTGTSSVHDATSWQFRFTERLPEIQRRAHAAFRNCSVELRTELIAEVTADCCVWFHRLAELGREPDEYVIALTRYAIKRVGCGLQVGNARNKFDVSSRYGQLQLGICRESLQWRDTDAGEWHEMTLESRGASPAEIAALRIDLRHWLSTLTLRQRAIALALAAGYETYRVAERFKLSRGRISQLRREFAASWHQLHGLDADGREPSTLAA